MLEDHADLAARRAQAVGVQRGQIVAVDDHPASAGPVQEVDGTHQRALAGPASADDAEDFTGRDGEADVAQRMHFPRPAGESLRESLQFDHGKRKENGNSVGSPALLPRIIFLKLAFYAIRFIPQTRFFRSPYALRAYRSTVDRIFANYESLESTIDD
ncbi:hypothetical protein D3C87_1416430 [compost metagenome]